MYFYEQNSTKILLPVTDIITGPDFHMVTSEIPSRFYKPHAGIASYTQV